MCCNKALSTQGHWLLNILIKAGLTSFHINCVYTRDHMFLQCFRTAKSKKLIQNILFVGSLKCLTRICYSTHTFILSFILTTNITRKYVKNVLKRERNIKKRYSTILGGNPAPNLKYVHRITNIMSTNLRMN